MRHLVIVAPTMGGARGLHAFLGILLVLASPVTPDVSAASLLV